MIEFKTLASGSSGNAYIVTDGKTPLLLEAGIKIRELRKKAKFGLGQIQGCLLSHCHQDHSCGVKEVMKAGIDCYMSKGTAQALELSGHRLHSVKSKEQFRVGSWTILPFEVIHDAADPLGFLLANEAGEKLLFATDTHYLPYRFQGLTHICIEANFDSEILKQNVDAGSVDPQVAKKLWHRHMSLGTVKRFLQANDLSKLEEIHLLHLSGFNSAPGKFQEEIQGLTGVPVFIAGE